MTSFFHRHLKRISLPPWITMENTISWSFQDKNQAEKLIIFLFMCTVMMTCLRVRVHTGVDLPVSLQGFFCLELGATLVTNYGLLASWTRDRKWMLITHNEKICIWTGEGKTGLKLRWDKLKKYISLKTLTCLFTLIFFCCFTLKHIKICQQCKSFVLSTREHFIPVIN